MDILSLRPTSCSTTLGRIGPSAGIEMGQEHAAVVEGAKIRRLMIHRFRGIQSLDWRPAPGLNVILGGGDAGKSTILDAIALLLNPTNATVLSDADYYQGDRTKKFFIGAVMSLPSTSGIHDQHALIAPWAWNGTDAVVPDLSEGAPPSDAEAVYKFCVTGTPDLDLNYDIRRPPSDETERFSQTLRRQIGLVRLGGDDRNDRDLRMVQGSALDRLLSDPALRSRFSAKLSGENFRDDLQPDGQTALDALDEQFRNRALPHDLDLGLSAQQGLSIGALVGLTAIKGETRLPLASWGAGTRRLAALAIAQACRSGCPITLIDEAERGLEPYRQRKLVADLIMGRSQVFMTTHSAAALAAAEGGKLWHLVRGQTIGALDTPKIALHQKDDPETFLARMAIVGEGPTEVGFLRYILETSLSGDLLDRGVKFCNGTGNAFARELLEEMSGAGFNVAGLVDDENDKPTLWSKLKGSMGDRLLQWPAACTETMVISRLDEGHFEALISDSDGNRGPSRLNTLVERLEVLRPELGRVTQSFEAISVAAGGDLRPLIIAAATGSKEGAPKNLEKTWKKHEKAWFKSEAGGRELAKKAETFGVMPNLSAWLAPFVAAIDQASGTSGG